MESSSSIGCDYKTLEERVPKKVWHGWAVNI
jgi:hypothetical protein